MSNSIEHQCQHCEDTATYQLVNAPPTKPVYVCGDCLIEVYADGEPAMCIEED